MELPCKRMRHALGVGGCAAALLSGTSTTVLAAEATPPAKAMYLKYCSACHGQGGKGDGVVSGFMRPKPTDLTQLAKKNDGKFPYMATIQAIDGTRTIRGHGGEDDMPVWGELFTADAAAPIGRHFEVRGKTMLITEYIASVQEE